jgi:hypothetical protein
MWLHRLHYQLKTHRLARYRVWRPPSSQPFQPSQGPRDQVDKISMPPYSEPTRPTQWFQYSLQQCWYAWLLFSGGRHLSPFDTRGPQHPWSTGWTATITLRRISPELTGYPSVWWTVSMFWPWMGGATTLALITVPPQTAMLALIWTSHLACIFLGWEYLAHSLMEILLSALLFSICTMLSLTPCWQEVISQELMTRTWWSSQRLCS